MNIVNNILHILYNYYIYNMTNTKRPLRHSNKQTRKKSKSRIKTIPGSLFKKLDALSPFEIKDKLMSLASEGSGEMLNAGRGNPNFFNEFVRVIFAKLQLLVTQFTNEKEHLKKDLDVYPNPGDYNYETIFLNGSKNWPEKEKVFLRDYLKFIKLQSSLQKKDYNLMLHDLFLSTLGCFYPVPPQVQEHLNFVCQDFMYDLVMGGGDQTGDEPGRKLKPTDFEFFPTEGAAAGILYALNTLKSNFLLNPGDSIAIITPIFSPYLELPRLKDYDLNIVELKTNPKKNYALDDEEINKLKDKKIKGLFMVNPTNPSAFALPKENIDKIGHLINTERKDMFVLNDSVYSPFCKRGAYNSFMISCPKNTIEVYSLSKYFGTTGWRLGLVMLPKDTNLNKMIWNLPQKQKKLLHDRYALNTIDPDKLTFMNRLVYDSRAVSEAHVAGLCTPAQVLIGLFLYYDLHDQGHKYQKEIRQLLAERIQILYHSLNTQPHITPVATDYYTLLHIPEITENLYGKEARKNLETKHNYIEFMFHLAKKYKTVLLPGKGFGDDSKDSQDWSLRACLANLSKKEYVDISKNLAQCIKDFI